MNAEAPKPINENLHAETVDAQLAYEAQLESNAKFAAEAPKFPAAAEQVENDIRRARYDQVVQTGLAHPERLSGHTSASGWDELHRAASEAGDRAALAHREQRGRERSFAESLATDSWDATVHTLDGARAKAETTGDWTEFDTYFDQLRTQERVAYSRYVDESRTPEPEPPKEPEPAPEPPKPAPPATEPKPPEPEPDEGEPEPGPDEPDQPDEPQGPKPPEGNEVKADDTPTAEMPALRNGKLPNFWEAADIARAKAQARGEEVPERKGPLPADYFDKITDLPADAISLLHMIGEANTAIAKGEYPSTERQNIISRLTDRLAASNPGVADKLIDIYGIGGRFQHEGMKLTAADAELIDLMHQYKANERDGSIRRKIFDLLAKINAEEDPVPVNWHEVENGPITPVGTATLSKGDWLFERHKGTLVRKQFEDMAKGTESVMAQPIGRWGRAGRAILRGARVLDPRSYLKSGVDTSKTSDLYRGRGPRTPENPDGWIVPPKK